MGQREKKKKEIKFKDARAARLKQCVFLKEFLFVSQIVYHL
jgi:hypothetical protein